MQCLAILMQDKHMNSNYTLSPSLNHHIQLRELQQQMVINPLLLRTIYLITTHFMKMALLERNFQDAIEEMNGERLYRLWKFKMLYFKKAGKTKYGLEAFYFVADQLSLLSPHEAHRQLWNRGFNLRGGAGNNVPLDLMVEHNSNAIKELIFKQGANVSFESAQLISQVSQGIEAVLDNLNVLLEVGKECSKHARVDKQKDVFRIAQEVLHQKDGCVLSWTFV